jgi:Sulfotransferase family
MYLNIGLASKALLHSYLGQPFRLRRWVIVACFMLLLASFWVVVAVGRALDHLLFPGFKRQVIRKPVFIIAPPRSGTTFLQKLLARNREVFAPVLMYQTIFPSITLQKIILGIASLGEKKDGLLGEVIGWVERHFFGGWDNMHKMRFNQPEEDDGFFVYTFVTEAIYLLFPYVGVSCATTEPACNDISTSTAGTRCSFPRRPNFQARSLACVRNFPMRGSSTSSATRPNPSPPTSVCSTLSGSGSTRHYQKRAGNLLNTRSWPPPGFATWR